MIEVGRLCIKTAGRDGGCKCVVVDILDGNYVLIDGETRRRKCNILHIEPLEEAIKIKKGASHENVKAEFKKLGIDLIDTKPKEKKERPRKIRKKKEAEDKQAGKKAKTAKKAAKTVIPKPKKKKEGNLADKLEQEDLAAEKPKKSNGK